MKKLIYIFILTTVFGCKIFGQPDTLEYYSKSWGDSMIVENQRLSDSVHQIDSAMSEMIKIILDMKLNVDTAYWQNDYADYSFMAISESGKAEARITLSDSTFMRLLYVGNSMNCMVRNKDGWIKGQLNFNFER